MSVLMKHNTPNSPARLLRAPRAVVGAITTSGHRGSGRVYGTHTPAHVVRQSYDAVLSNTMHRDTESRVRKARATPNRALWRVVGIGGSCRLR